MPNTSSAKKALRSSLKKRDRNKAYKEKIKEVVREFKKSVNISDSKVGKKLDQVFSVIDKAVKKRIWHKNKGARKKSQFSKMMNTALPSKTDTPEQEEQKNT